MARSAPRHDRDAGGPADVLAAKAALREEVWSAMRAAKVARFPGAPGRIPNFTGAEAAAERLRGLPAWQGADTVKANPDSAQLPVRQRALEDGKTVYMAVPRLAEREPFFALDPDHLDQPPRKAASISGATRSARRVTLAELTPVGLVVMGSVAAAEDGARLGKGGGFADLEFALATAAGLIGPDTVTVTTVHEIQVRPAGTIPLTSHDVPVDFVVTPDRVIDCRARRAPRPVAGIVWDDLTEEKIAAIPLLTALKSSAPAHCGDTGLAEDLTAESFLAAVHAVRKPGAPDPSVPWLPEVARHLHRTVHATEALLVRARAAFRRIYEEQEGSR